MKTTTLLLSALLWAAAAKAGEEYRLPQGGRCKAGVLRVTFKDDFAARISTDPAGRSKAVNAADITALDRGIDRVMAKHTAARLWLQGNAVPAHLKKGGKVPRISRNVNVVLKPGEDLLEAAKRLKQAPGVERVSVIRLYETTALPNDSLYSQQWGMSRIGVPDGDWDIAGRGRVRVAVVDTGVDRQHPDLAARIVYGTDFGDDAPSDGDAPTDRRNRFDHGTHVAGIVAAIRNNGTGVAGVSNNIDLMAMGCASWSDDANPPQYLIGNAGDAIDDAVANGARVINCSFGTSRSGGRADIDSDLNDAIDNAYDNNVLVVAAAGNDAMDTTDHDWAQSAVPFIVSASSQASPEVFDTNYSNSGPRIDLCAPGTGIQSTLPTGGPPGTAIYGSKNGTSMAAPHVAGAAAHIISMNPGLIEDHSAKHLLIRMAQDAGPAGRDNQYGWGLLRLRREHLQVLRDADTFVSNTDVTGGDVGTYDQPLASIPAGVAAVPAGGTVVLNGGDNGTTEFHYPPITITKGCILKALPDTRVIIGQ